MENFKNKIKSRRNLLIYLGLIFTIFVLITGVWGYNNSIINNDEHLGSFLQGASAGAFAGCLLVILKTIFKYNSILKDENKLKLMYIEENDEREILIRDKMGRSSSYIVFGGTVVCAIVTSYIDTTISLTLFLLIVFMVIVKVITKFYYKAKF